MGDTGKIAKNLERFAQAVGAHDRENPTHTAWGIGLAHYDMERLGLEEGEQILPGITLQCDGGVSGNFRVLCDGEHDEGRSESEREVVVGVASPPGSPGTAALERSPTSPPTPRGRSTATVMGAAPRGS